MSEPKWWQFAAKSRRRNLIRRHDEIRDSQRFWWKFSGAMAGELMPFPEGEMGEKRAVLIGAPDPRLSTPLPAAAVGSTQASAPESE